MTVSVENIIPAKEAEAVQTAQFTSTNAKTIIDKFTATNTDVQPRNISVNIIPKAGVADDDNLIVDNKTLAVDETYTFPELVGHVMAKDDFISTVANAVNTITIRASGRVIT